MSTDAVALALLTLGGLFLASLVADLAGRRTRLPRVTLLLIVCIGIGPIGLDLVADWRTSWFPFITDLALVMVAFLLGGEMTRSMLQEHGRVVLITSLVVVAVSFGVVAMGLLALGWSPVIALMLAAIATSTDPAAVTDVIRETGARGPFSKTLLGIVAVDDAWGIVMMSVAMALVLGIRTPEAVATAVGEGLFDLGGAVLIGLALGLPMALLSGRVRPGEPTQVEALGAVLLFGGLALFPQAGIALGMALLVAERFPEVGASILTATVTGTILFEVLGPVMTRLAVRRSLDADSIGH